MRTCVFRAALLVALSQPALAVQTYTLIDDLYCKALNGRSTASSSTPTRRS